MNEILKSDFFEKGKDGVKRILTPDDKKIDIIKMMYDNPNIPYLLKGQGNDSFIFPTNENKRLLLEKQMVVYVILKMDLIHFAPQK